MTTGFTIAAMSTAWNASRPSCAFTFCPVMARMGMESTWAVYSPVTKLLAPGPEVAAQTPTVPIARAYPSAMWIAPSSCRHRKCRMVPRSLRER